MPLQIEFFNREELEAKYNKEYYENAKTDDIVDNSDYIKNRIDDYYDKFFIAKDVKAIVKLYAKKGAFGKMVMHENHE